MTNSNLSKQLKKFLPYIIITIFALAFTFVGTTLAKFVSNTSEEGEVVVSDFYFESVLLSEMETAEETPNEVYLYGTDHFTVGLTNTFEGKVSEVDTYFEITVTGDAFLAVEENLNCENVITGETITGKMPAGSACLLKIRVIPDNTVDPIKVVATATSAEDAAATGAYKKILGGVFKTKNPLAIPGNEIGAVTVPHDKYTELLVVAGTEFTGDVYVIFNDFKTTKKYFPRELEVAKAVKFYYKPETGNPTAETQVYNYVETFKTHPEPEYYNNAVFFLDLDDIFETPTSHSLLPNRTYVIDFLGDMEIDESQYGGILYSDVISGETAQTLIATPRDAVIFTKIAEPQS